MMKKVFTVLFLTTLLLNFHFTTFSQSLPYAEEWNSGTLGDWTSNSGNWFVNASSGNPPPAVEFNASNGQLNYEDSLMSPVIYASEYEGSLMYLAFDLKLEDISSNGTEKFAVRLYVGDSVYDIWQTRNFSDLDWYNYDLDITDEALGQDFRIGFVAMGEDAANISNWGIDNIIVDLICPAPYDVEAEYVDDTGTVLITWHTADTLGPDNEWLHYDDGVNFSSIGYNGPGDFNAAIRFDHSQINNYAGSFLTKVSFYPAVEECEYSIRVWKGENAANLVHEQAVADPEIGEWNIVELDSSVLIEENQELWFGYNIDSQGGFPAGVDAGPAVVGYGDMLYDPAEGWISMATETGLNYNWNIQGYVTSGSGDTTQSALIGYNVYHTLNNNDPVKLNEVPLEENTYIHGGLSPYHSNCYSIEAVFDNCNSSLSLDECLPILIGNSEMTAANEDIIKFYPNPASDQINISSSEKMERVSVYNYTGRKLLEENAKGSKECMVDTGFLEEGLNIIRIETTGGIVTRKVTIAR